MWIKICGLTTPEAVAAAVDAGVHAIGFVFAESVRQVTIERANVLAKAARGRVRCVAVFRELGPEARDVIAQFRPDILQADAASLAPWPVPTGIERLPVLRSGRPLPATLPARALYEGPVSGAGAVSDWIEARDLATRTQLVLAGGLDPANVEAAIRAVRPHGVDVSSGVESAPGIKSVEKIKSFVAAARAANLEKA